MNTGLNKIGFGNSGKLGMAGVAGIAGVTGFIMGAGIFWGIFRKPQSAHMGAAWPAQKSLAILNSKVIQVKDLSEAARQKLEILSERRAEDLFQAEFEHYRLTHKLFKDHIYMSLSQDEAKVPLVKAPSEESAWQLFQASDPLGTKKDFEILKPKLLAYIDEVMKREAVEELLDAEESKRNLTWQIPPPMPPTSLSLVTEGFPALGPASAKAVVTQFVDFLCPNCTDYNVKFAQLVEKYRLSVRFVFLPFPYSRPDRSIGLARGSLCAHEQGKYLDFHMQVVSLGSQAFEAQPLALAKASGLQLKNFVTCYGSGSSVASLLAITEAQAKRVGLVKTPVSFLGARAFYGAEGLNLLEKELSLLK